MNIFTILLLIILIYLAIKDENGRINRKRLLIFSLFALVMGILFLIMVLPAILANK
ncbi:hypothetical protein [Periweissella beninensis]|uniref:Uncharacterized protein n=1 Tax=Periweissella beninensis TaxID=504936 RepID=A0ABT0VIV6_9LACO|nr:hypothetical protein [Periweissella beninensis]MBM7544260.1 uncharacterized membrane protein YhaH (DUF805 family) [Periweissella beninensis]MCM2437762.1 hypothetical protein [Periweissella beninensis]